VVEESDNSQISAHDRCPFIPFPTLNLPGSSLLGLDEWLFLQRVGKAIPGLDFLGRIERIIGFRNDIGKMRFYGVPSYEERFT
jgi:hypothetical protein